MLMIRLKGQGGRILRATISTAPIKMKSKLITVDRKVQTLTGKQFVDRIAEYGVLYILGEVKPCL
jgi:hypothetical protein